MNSRSSVIVLVAAALGACTTMRPVESPVTFLEQNNPKHVRVYDSRGELYVLRDPQLRGDTIRGFEPLEQEELSISLNGIRRMEALQPDKGKTTLLIGALALIGGAGIYMIANASDGQKLICDDYQVGNRCYPAPQQGRSAARLALPLRF